MVKVDLFWEHLLQKKYCRKQFCRKQFCGKQFCKTIVFESFNKYDYEFGFVSINIYSPQGPIDSMKDKYLFISEPRMKANKSGDNNDNYKQVLYELNQIGLYSGCNGHWCDTFWCMFK